MAETLTIRTASSAEVVKIAVQGAQGPAGASGAAGPANTLSIGTVTSGATASATLTGTAPAQTLSLVLPKGDKGDAGAQGPAGAGIATLTTKGDTLYRGDTTGERLPIGAAGQVLKVSSGGLPEWGAAPSGVSSWNDLADKPSAFTPTAHAAAHAAGLKAQYSGQVAGMTSNAIIRANNAGTAGNSIALSFSGATKGTFTGQVAGMTSNVTIRALGFGTSGNAVLSFDGSTLIEDAIANNGAVELVSGDGTQVPNDGEDISLTGGGGSIEDVLAAWNSANPSNQATVFVGGSQGPNSGTSITLSGGVAVGSDPISDPAFNSIGIGVAAPQSTGQLIAIRTEEGGQDSLLKAISTTNTTSTDSNWRGRIMNGAENRTFLMGCYLGEAGLGAHSWSSAKNESGAAWADFLINPDGGADVFIGCQSWDKTKAILKVGNSDGKVTISDKASPTKKFSFDVSGVTAGQTRSLSVPNASGTIALLSDIPSASGVTDGDKGDITVSASGATWTIDSNAVTNAKLAQVATSTLKGRSTAGTGNVEDLTASQVRTILNVADGATANATNAQLRDRSTHTGTQIASTISDFNAAAAAAAPVQSVAGRTGTITLAKADVGLGNVDNTSDANKPISTATQTALDGKAATSHSHAISDVTGLQTALDGKQASGSYAAATHTHTPSEVGLGNVSNTAQVTSVTGTAPIVSSGGTTPAISVTVGTGANTVAAGDDSRFHTRSHAMTGTSDHTAGNWSVFYSNGSGQVNELALGAANTVLTSNGASSAPSFAAASGGGSGGTKTYAFFAATGSNQPPATNFAVLDTRNSISVLGFRDTTADDSAIFVGVMPEAAVLSSGLKVRIHWMSATQTSNNVRWRAHFQRCDTGTDLDSDSFDNNASNEATGTASSTLGAPTITEITCGSGAIDGIVAGDAYRLRITREQSDTTLDTMMGLAQVFAVEVRSAA